MAKPGTARAALEAEPPLNACLLQTTLGVTSEGFQDALAEALFCGGMLPPSDPEQVCGGGPAHTPFWLQYLGEIIVKLEKTGREVMEI